MSLEFVRVKEEIDWESVENEQNNCMKQERDSVANEVLHVKVESQWNSVNNTCLRVSEREFNANEHWCFKKELEHGVRGAQIEQEKEDCEVSEWANVKIEKELEFDTRLTEYEVKHEVFSGPEELQLQDIAHLQDNKTVSYKNSEHRATPPCSNFLQNKDENKMGLHTITMPSRTDKKLKKYCQKSKSKSYLRIQRSEKVNLIQFEGQPEQNQYICDTCGKQFQRKINVIVHLRSHLNQSRCVCDICHKRYSNMFNLRRHKLIHIGEKPHCCDVCNRRFTDPCNLVSHKRLHSEEKPYTCEVCNKQFRQNAHLRGHMRVHTGEKPFPCKICNKQFSSVYNLNRHKRTHTGEKPFSCEFCEKQFADVRNLARHKLLHSEEPAPFECDLCLKPFRDYSNLVKHKQIHSGITVKCEVCRKLFSNLYNLNRHKRYRCKSKKVKLESV